MRWPFRRRTTPVTGRERAETTSARPTRDPVPPRAPGPVPSRPRFDWAHLPAMQRTVDVRPPLTFHGERFGRSVAGARAIDAATRPRSHRRDTAPSGIMLDVAKVETIEPVPDRPQPTVPPVLPDPIGVQRSRQIPHVHRVTPTRDLTTADTTVEFEPAPERERPIPSTVSWTAERGFVEERTGESTTDDDGESAAAPQLRYVPTTEERHERPSRDLVDLVQQATGVDVGDAVIDRSPAVSDRADELGAVAFTERGTVHLPAELGDIGEPGVRGVVAHELTHVAQQRARRSEAPAEDSVDGRELEAEARAVQRAAGGAVRPTVMRRRAHAPESQAGVQRLAADEAHDRQFAWQERSEERSPSQTRSALGLFGGYSWRAGSAGDRALQREDEQWRRDFEREHRDDLLERRQTHYQEIVERRLELKRARAPEAEREHVELDPRDVIAAREQLDRDMPFEFELPASVDLYPGELPEADPDDEEGTATGDEPGTGAGGTTAPSTPPGVRRSPVSAASAASATAANRPGTRTPPRRPGSPGGATGPGSTESTPGFDWQRREPTDQQAVTALFGGGLFGDLLSRAVGEETDAGRRAAEADRLPDLNRERQRREGELRHRRLQDKLRVSQTEARREERDTPAKADQPDRRRDHRDPRADRPRHATGVRCADVSRRRHRHHDRHPGHHHRRSARTRRRRAGNRVR